MRLPLGIFVASLLAWPALAQLSYADQVAHCRKAPGPLFKVSWADIEKHGAQDPGDVVDAKAGFDSCMANMNANAIAIGEAMRNSAERAERLRRDQRRDLDLLAPDTTYTRCRQVGAEWVCRHSPN